MLELPTQPSLILMIIGIVRVLDQRIDTFFVFKPPGDAQKSYRVTNFSFSTNVRITFYVPSKWVFSVKTSDWVRQKGIAMSKNKKNKKTNNNLKKSQFFFLIFFLSNAPTHLLFQKQNKTYKILKAAIFEKS
jgi:hypothetical protein